MGIKVTSIDFTHSTLVILKDDGNIVKIYINVSHNKDHYYCGKYPKLNF